MYNLAPRCYRACWLVEKPKGQGSNSVSADTLGDMGQIRVGPSPPNIAHGHAKQGQERQRDISPLFRNVTPVASSSATLQPLPLPCFRISFQAGFWVWDATELRCWWCWRSVWCPKARWISAEKGFLCVTPSTDKAHWGAYGTRTATSVGYGYCLLP